jgi:outer membrane PBP1 activator LpoA protein
MTATWVRLFKRAALPALLMTGILQGCESTPEKPTVPDKPPVVERPVASYGPLELPASEHAAVFAQAEQAIAAFNWMTAQRDLDALPQDPPLGLNDAVYQNYLQARIDWLRGNRASADQHLQGQAGRGAAPALNNKILDFQRQLLADTGDYLQPQSPESAAARKRDTWLNLMRTPADKLKTERQQTTDPRWRAWLELAQIGNAMSSIGEQQQRLGLWLTSNPGHPASQPLPGGLDNWLQTPSQQQQVVLLLPLGGRLAPAAKAVRDGYLASYYAARLRGEADFELQVLDTGLFQSTVAAYDAASAAGATMVIGPLSKEAVEELGSHPARAVPVLALNRVDGIINPGGASFVQMSLAPEDEARRVAELAYGQGGRRALLVRPAGAWGNKITQALQSRWTELGGSIAATAPYSSQEDYSNRIKTALDLAESEERSREVRNMLATNIEFTARRRQDIDVVFLLSRSGPEARSIKPLLAYHYAGNLPVFATSSIYSGLPDTRDKDLNGINLVDIPWLLGSNPALRVAITAGDTGSDSYTRLNALGADAYRLQSRFSQLQAGPDALVPGDTGLLTLDPGQKMLREPRLATFAGGKLQAR